MENCHHLFWQKEDHRHHLRNEPTLKPKVDIYAHRELHINCPRVTKLSREVIRIVKNEFIPATNTLESIDNLLCAMDYASNIAYEREETEYAMHAIEMQIPYLRGNIR